MALPLLCASCCACVELIWNLIRFRVSILVLLGTDSFPIDYACAVGHSEVPPFLTRPSQHLVHSRLNIRAFIFTTVIHASDPHHSKVVLSCCTMPVSRSTVISDLPCEILQKVALCLPRTADVFHLSLATRYLRASLTDPVLFKRRLSLAEWDVESWEEEDRDRVETEATGEIQARSDRWMRIDHIHSRVHELFVEGSSSRAIAPHTSPMILSGQGSHNGPNKSLRGIASEQRDGTAELGQKILWLANVGRLLPAVIMHHRKPIYCPQAS